MDVDPEAELRFWARVADDADELSSLGVGWSRDELVVTVYRAATGADPGQGSAQCDHRLQ
jgi:hypothetical protein